jgi:origin recognition complex subunit 5
MNSQIMELTSMRLLFRTSPSDRLDGPPMFKCAISYDATLALAKQLMIPLNDLLWDPM